MKRVIVIMSDKGYWHTILKTWESRPDLATWYDTGSQAYDDMIRNSLETDKSVTSVALMVKA